jgi:3-oxoadipate enol-lactonase
MTDKVVRDGCALAYRIDGPQDGPALLLSNSLGTTMEMWAPQVAAFAERCRVIRYDTRGHGESDAPAAEYSLDELGRDALAVLDAAGAAHAHVCGASLGGLTAMWLGLHAAARVDSLILASTAARIGTVDMWNERIRHVLAEGTESIADVILTRWFTDGYRLVRPDGVAGFRAMLAGTPRQGYAGCCAALRDADLRQEIRAIAAPTLVISAISDPATPPADGRHLHAAIVHSELALLDGSHLASAEVPYRFNQALLSFVEARGLATGKRSING